MNLLSINTARAVWNFYTRDFNPRGRYIAVPAFTNLIEKYHFSSHPKPTDELDETKGIFFKDGEFVIENGESIVVSLAIYNNGVIADTRSSTAHSEAFVKDAMDTIASNCKLPPYEGIIRSKGYVSEVYISTEKSLNALNPKLQTFSKKLNKLVKGHDVVDYEVAGLQFWNNPSLNAPFPFRLERQESIGFKENRYYSIAPLETEVHLELLNEIEAILG